MGILKTATGVFSGSIALDAFKADSRMSYHQPVEKLAVKGAGSLAAAMAIHTLKDEAADVIQVIRGKPVKKLDR